MPTSTNALSDAGRDEGTILLKTKACKYRIQKTEIMACLEVYYKVRTELFEDCCMLV
jgi:hypothetical protein